MAVEAGLSVYVVGGQGVRLFVVVVNGGVLDVFFYWEDFCLVMYVMTTDIIVSSIKLFSHNASVVDYSGTGELQANPHVAGPRLSSV